MMEGILKELQKLQKMQEKRLAQARNELGQIEDPIMKKFLSQSLQDARDGKLSVADFIAKLQKMTYEQGAAPLAKEDNK